MSSVREFNFFLPDIGQEPCRLETNQLEAVISPNSIPAIPLHEVEQTPIAQPPVTFRRTFGARSILRILGRLTTP